MRKKWTRAEIEALHDGLAAGKTVAELAAELGCSPRAVSSKKCDLKLGARRGTPPQPVGDVPCIPKRNYARGLNLTRIRAAADPGGELEDQILLYPAGTGQVRKAFNGAALTLPQTDRLIALLTSLRNEAAADPGPRSSTSSPQEKCA